MPALHITGLDDHLTDTVRRTMRAPEYGHPVMREVAAGTGPCRACLRQFRIGEEERLLFTYRPVSESGTLGAPGPVFIHAEPCTRYVGTSFPPDLLTLPLLIEARSRDNRIPLSCTVTGGDVDAVLERLLADPDVEYLYVRHGVAGCHIVRVDRTPAGG